ncbi:hypothetical protein TEA_017323 [Camellia sinensis var. sinensis]|uniref:Cytochrome P450 n=1 Tax=Camellia sinensis var. sinensis TaxID=542762 RepID=A0A4S4ECR3_CAMSN|nr:hypothetical protein TEA_017323 [Camellia sinensis var. sinensis]
MLWLLKSSQDFSNLETILRRLHTKHGPILTLHISSRPSIFITTCELTHRALVQNATIFTNRPQAIETTKVIFSNHRIVSFAAYGSLWKVIRQNLASILHPSRLNVYSGGRKWAYDKQEDVLVPLIRQRRKKINNTKEEDEGESIVSYVDTLFDLRLSQANNARTELSEGEMLSLCSEFINGGTDTSTTTLQRAMANLVKHQEIQEKLYGEINVVVKRREEIKEQDLKKMPYLEAIVLETLRRHPPGHFILPRAVIEDTDGRLRYTNECHGEFHSGREGLGPKCVGKIQWSLD